MYKSDNIYPYPLTAISKLIYMRCHKDIVRVITDHPRVLNSKSGNSKLTYFIPTAWYRQPVLTLGREIRKRERERERETKSVCV